MEQPACSNIVGQPPIISATAKKCLVLLESVTSDHVCRFTRTAGYPMPWLFKLDALLAG